jgi:hypothetical protein
VPVNLGVKTQFNELNHILLVLTNIGKTLIRVTPAAEFHVHVNNEPICIHVASSVDDQVC